MNKKTKKVLVVEDEESLQLAINAKLEKAGMTTFLARRVEDALKIMKKEKKVDAIWLDHYLLGKENGLDFVVEIKGNPKWKQIPVFVVSNTATPDKIEGYLKLGVHKYYTKANLKMDHILKEIQAL